MSHIIFCSCRYDACILMFVWMFVPVPQYNFIIHDICMKTLNVYFHAVKKRQFSSRVWNIQICSTSYNLKTWQQIVFSLKLYTFQCNVFVKRVFTEIWVYLCWNSSMCNDHLLWVAFPPATIWIICSSVLIVFIFRWCFTVCGFMRGSKYSSLAAAQQKCLWMSPVCPLQVRIYITA